MSRIAVITPVFNSASLLGDTLKSVLNQEGMEGSDISYIICDGASTDGTLDIAGSYMEKFAATGINYKVVSQKDSGMYDALANGFKIVGNNHDIYTYINAGDYFSPYAFRVVQGLIPKQTRWITGLTVSYNSHAYLVQATTPLMYPRTLIKQGFFGRTLPFIQQESTFWGREVHQRINLNELAKFKLAGDYYLWRQLAEYTELDIVECWLGGFRTHEGQLSQQHLERYMNEFKSIADKRTLFSFLQAYALWVGWKSPRSLRHLVNKKILTF